MVKLLEFPDRDIGDVARGLRALADGIEKGDHGDAHNLAWVLDCGDGNIKVGLLGRAAEAGVTAYFLYGLAKRKIEGGSLV